MPLQQLVEKFPYFLALSRINAQPGVDVGTYQPGPDGTLMIGGIAGPKIAVVIGFEITVLVKLAYGNLMTMNTVLETVRETQLSILEHLNPAQHAGQQKEV